MTNINWKAEEAQLDRHKEITDRLKHLVVETLNLDIDPEVIQEDQPLFGRGLELDSIDALELSMHVSEEFGVEMSDDNMAVWGSLNRLADFIIAETSKDKAA